jgi:hypothetical protein
MQASANAYGERAWILVASETTRLDSQNRLGQSRFRARKRFELHGGR